MLEATVRGWVEGTEQGRRREPRATLRIRWRRRHSLRGHPGLPASQRPSRLALRLLTHTDARQAAPRPGRPTSPRCPGGALSHHASPLASRRGWAGGGRRESLRAPAGRARGSDPVSTPHSTPAVSLHFAQRVKAQLRVLRSLPQACTPPPQKGQGQGKVRSA